jgi:hypothetical protein
MATFNYEEEHTQRDIFDWVRVEYSLAENHIEFSGFATVLHNIILSIQERVPALVLERAFHTAHSERQFRRTCEGKDANNG